MRSYNADVGPLTGQTVASAPKAPSGSMVRAVMSPGSVAATADAITGTVDFSTAFTTIEVYVDGIKDTAAWTFAVDSLDGITGAFGTGADANKFSVSAFVSDATVVGKADLIVYKAGYTTWSFTFVVNKAYKVVEALATVITSGSNLGGLTTTPTTPTIIVKTLFDTAYLSWDKQSDLTGQISHKIYRSDVIDSGYVHVGSSDGYTYEDTALALNGTADKPTARIYYYKVSRLVNGVTESASSVAASATVASLPATAVAANAINAAKVAAGTRDSPNDPTSYWSMDDVPEMPTSLVGLIYSKSTFVAADIQTGTTAPSATAFAYRDGSASAWKNSVLSIVNGEINVANEVTSYDDYIRINIAPQSKKVRLKLFSPTACTARMEADSTVYTIALAANTWTLFDASFSATGSAILDIAVPIVGTWKMSAAYIGTGAYLANSLLDNSGNGNHGTIVGATPIVGLSGNALRFDGNTDYVTGTPTLGAPDIYAVSFWAKQSGVNNTAAIGRAPIMVGQTANAGMFVYAENGSSAYNLRVYRAAASETIAAAFTLATGVWAHIVINVSCTAKAYSVYKDGVLSKSGSFIDTPVAPVDTLIIGSTSSSSNRFLGDLDEPRVYVRGLSEAEVKYLNENVVTSKGMIVTDQLVANCITADKIFAGAITTAKLAADSVEADKINVAELSAISADLGDISAGRINVTGDDPDAPLKSYIDMANGSMRMGTPTVGIEYDGAAETFDIRGVQMELTESDLTTTSSDGVSLSHEGQSLVWRDPAGAEITRINSKGAPIVQPWNGKALALNELTDFQSLIQQQNGTLRVVFTLVGDGKLYEQTKTGTAAWSAKSLVLNEAAGYSSLIQQQDETLRVMFVLLSDGKLYEQTKVGAGAWSAKSLVLNEVASYLSLIQQQDETLRVVFRLGADNKLYEQTKTGTAAWSAKSLVLNEAAGYSSLIQQQDGTLRNIFTTSTNKLYELTKVGTAAWSAKSLVLDEAVSTPSLIQQQNGTLRVVFTTSTNKLYEQTKTGTAAWSAKSLVLDEAVSTQSLIQQQDGTIRVTYKLSADAKRYEQTLDFYAALGAGIIAKTPTLLTFSGGVTVAPDNSQTDWSTKGAISRVAGMLAWKNYGNSHVIFDASNSTTPSGTACSNATPTVSWTAAYPTLMGWNGSSTYGVRVDTARYAENGVYSSNTGFVRFNNGLQICYGTRISVASAGVAWSFPAGFSAAPYVVASASNSYGTSLISALSQATTTYVDFSLIVSQSGLYYTGTAYVDFIAIGAW